MNKETYKCQFSPDGKNWITDSLRKIEKAYNFLVGKEAITWKKLNPYGSIRIVNKRTGFIVQR